MRKVVVHRSCCCCRRGASAHPVAARLRLRLIISRTTVSSRAAATALDQNVPFERILARKALITVTARERLYREVDSLVPLQVVIPVEALGTLVALEGPIMVRRLLWGACPVLTVHGLRVGSVATVKAYWKHIRLYVAHHRHLCSGTVHIRHNRTGHSWQGVGRSWWPHKRALRMRRKRSLMESGRYPRRRQWLRVRAMRNRGVSCIGISRGMRS